MKNLIQPINNLPKFSLIAFVLFALVFTSCDNEEDTQPAGDTITEEEVVAIVEGSLMTDTDGVTAEAKDAAYVTEESMEMSDPEICSLSFDTTVIRNLNTVRATANYESDWEWFITCNDQNIPVSMQFSRVSTGDYETLRLASDDGSNSSLVVTNLLAGENYVINGSYTREGTQESLVRDQNTFASTIQFNLIDLNVNKEDYTIESGSATFVLTGAGSGGSVNFSHEGTVIFNGDSTATLTINGNTYDIDWNP